MKRIQSSNQRSLKSIFLFQLIIFSSVFILLLVFSISVSINALHENTAQSNRNTAKLYLNQVENKLAMYEKNMAYFFSANQCGKIDGTKNNDERVLMIQQILNSLEDESSLVGSPDSLFIYYPQIGQYISSTLSSFPFDGNFALQDYIKSSVPDNSIPTKWILKDLCGADYLIRVLKINGTDYIGICYSVDAMLDPLPSDELGHSSISFFKGNGISLVPSSTLPEYITRISPLIKNFSMIGSLNEHYLVTSNKLGSSDIYYMIFTPDINILSDIKILLYAIIISVVLTIAFLVIYLKTLQVKILHPLNNLLFEIERIRSNTNNSTTAITVVNSSHEFQVLTVSFQNMMKEIHNLQIENYEKQIYSQKIEYKQLQSQLKPHFFLNMLNDIYSLARSRQYDLLMEMSLCLIKYFRYMFRSSMEMVFLNEEVEHITNYMHIQKLRHGSRCTFNLRVENEVASVPIPPLIIYTFIDNCLKHANKTDGQLSISLTAESFEIARKRYCRIIIADNGQGFSPEILSAANTTNPAIDFRNEHIGISNTIRRLNLQYSGEAKYCFRNCEEGGAVVELEIPY